MVSRIDDLKCWKCGAALDELPQPLARIEECPVCRCDVRVCKLCEFYDTKVAKDCREPVAEEVQNKERANFCGYFQARPHAYIPPDQTAVAGAKSDLDALFDLPDADPGGAQANTARTQLDGLFDPGSGDGD